MLAQRRIEAEWLDELAADDRRAMRSRRDLRRVNVLMLNAGIMARALRSDFGRPRTILDLGAGDGSFMLEVARRLGWRDATVVLLDRQNLVTGASRDSFRRLGLTAEPVAADVFDYLEQAQGARLDLIAANLFLHHFSPAQLRRLLALSARIAGTFIACEPRRAALPLMASHLLWAVGCNDVTRHDAPASVRAGFDRRELTALWPDHGQWELKEGAAKLFTHVFVARRRAGASP